MGPGSVHLTGRRYTAVNWSTPIAPVPMWLKELLTRKPVDTFKPANAEPADSSRAIEGILRFLSEAVAGTDRNHRLYWASCRMFERVSQGQLPEAQAWDLLLTKAADIGLLHGEADATIASARRTVAA